MLVDAKIAIPFANKVLEKVKIRNLNQPFFSFLIIKNIFSINELGYGLNELIYK